MKVDSPVSLIYSDSTLHITSSCYHSVQLRRKKNPTLVLQWVLHNVAYNLSHFLLKSRLNKDCEVCKC